MGKFDKRFFDENEFNKPDPWGFFTSEYEQTKYKRQIDVIKSFCPKPENIFEISCAEGAHTSMLANAFPQTEILGLDISGNAISRAKENCKSMKNIKLIEADVIECFRQGRLPKNEFDVTIQSESIYYIGTRMSVPEACDYLSGLMDTLKTNGLFLTANIIDQPFPYPEAPLTRKPVMEAYYAMMSGLSQPVYFSKHKEWKEEEKNTFEYEIRAFRKF